MSATNRQLVGEVPAMRIGVIGRITSAEEHGRYVRIQQLSDEPPSYVVLTASDRNFQSEGGDAWVEDETSLRQYFEESRWTVQWED
ncbi:hypothetical protein OG883_28745 [Streptomyces sp. NBC_01142]|uniref:hypothetical protein n=1 Tax=Streptomyces sp. NBC_01142 TaxID=2975865 RepID=UPI00224DAFC4|nr:hypothetical protein [Streptomyces sp. NBC_01142]MCX4823792.1 hypothetical protein [Streptomyces sp. NBC_01142]